MRVLKQQKVVRRSAGFAGGDQLLLQSQGWAVGDASEFADLALTH